MKNKIYKLLSIMLSIAIVLSVCSHAFTTVYADETIAYYVDKDKGNDVDNNGLSADSPLKTIEGVINKANDAKISEGTVVTAYIKRASGSTNAERTVNYSTSTASPVELPAHKFTLRITTVPNNTIGLLGNQSVIYGGPMIFDYVNVFSGSATCVYSNGNKVDFTNNTVISKSTLFSIGSTDNSEFENNINLSFKNLDIQGKFYLGNNNNSRTFSGNITLECDSTEYDPTIFLGGVNNSGTTTTYNGNININLKSSKSIFKLDKNANTKIKFGENVALQIKNSSGNSISYASTNLSDDIIGTAGNYFYLNLNSADEEKLQFTDTAGKFEVDTEKYIVTALPTDANGGDAVEAKDGYLTLTENGYYNITFADVPEEPEQPEEKEPQTVPYYVSCDGDDDNNDGSNENNAFKTIGGAIADAKEKGLGAIDTVNIKIVTNASNDVLWGTEGEDGWVRLTEHDFKVNVSSTGSITDIGNQNVVLGGPMYFENVHFKALTNVGGQTIAFNGNNIDFGDKVNVNAYYRFVAGDNKSTTEYKDKININFTNVANNEFKMYLSNLKNDRIFSGDFNVTFNSPSSRSDIYLGTLDGGNTTYNGNINLNVKSSSTDFTISRKDTAKKFSFGKGKALQIINSSGHNITCNEKYITEEDIDQAGDYFFITNNSGFKEALQFTETAGKFAVNTAKYSVKAYLLDSNGEKTGDAILTQEGYLNLTTSGKYCVEVEKNPLYEEFYVSSAVETPGDGLTEETAVKTVGEAVEKAVEANYGKGDEITIKVMGTTAEIGVIPSYEFELLVESNSNKKAVLTFTEGSYADGVYTLANGGDTTYRNVVISLKKEYRYALLNWSNVVFEADVVFDFHMYAGVAYGTNTLTNNDSIGGQKVEFKCNIPPYIKFSNVSYSNITFHDDVTLVLEGDGKPEVSANTINSSGVPSKYTTYNKNLNILDNQAYAVLLTDLELATFNGKIQVINGTTADYAANMRHVDAKKIIINNKTGNKQLLDFTKTAGKFSVNGENLLYVFKDGKQITTSKDGYIDVTAFGDGEYDVVDSREKTYNATTTVAAAVQKAINDGYTTHDVITVNVDGETINLGTLPEYDFDLVVKSDDKATVIVDDTALLANGGKVTYKNVVIKYTGNDSVNLADQDAKFDKNVVFDIDGKLYIGKNADDVDGQNLEFLSFVDEIVLSNGANKTYKGDLNITLNSDNATTIYFGDEAGTTYEKNINMYVEKAQSINFVNNATFGGALQIINSSENNINASTNGIAGVNAYIITDKTGIYKAIECTDIAGKYKLNFDTSLYNVTVKKNNSTVVENAVSGKYITLLESGEYTVTAELKGKYQSYIYERTSNNGNTSLQNFAAKINRGEEVNVVYMGGSVTNGSGATEREANSWRAIVGKWLVENFPNAKINNINRAIGATGSLLGSYRVGYDVIAEKPDLFIIEFSINDWLGNFSYENARRQFETIVRNTRIALPECDIMTVFTPDERLVSESRKQDENTPGEIHMQAKAHEEIAEKYGMPSIHIGRALLDTLPDNFTQDDWDYYFMDTVHPNDNGYVVYAEVVKEFLAGCLFTQPKEVKKHVLPRMVSKTLLDGNIQHILPDDNFVNKFNIENYNVEYIRRFEDIVPIINLTKDNGALKFEFEGTELSIKEFNATEAKQYIKYNVEVTAEDGTKHYPEKPVEFTNTPEYPIFIISNLPYGKYTVELSIAEDSYGTKSRLDNFFVRDDRAETVEVNGDINIDNDFDIRDLVTADLVQKDSFDDIYGLGMADKNMDGVVNDADIEILRYELLTGEVYTPETHGQENSDVVTLSAVDAIDEKQQLTLLFDQKSKLFVV